MGWWLGLAAGHLGPGFLFHRKIVSKPEFRASRMRFAMPIPRGGPYGTSNATRRRPFGCKADRRHPNFDTRNPRQLRRSPQGPGPGFFPGSPLTLRASLPIVPSAERELTGTGLPDCVPFV